MERDGRSPSPAPGDDPAAEARAVGSRLARLADPRQRAGALGRHLRELEPERSAALLGAAIEQADRREPEGVLLLQTLLDPGVREAWGVGLAQRVMAHARSQGRFDLAGILLEMPGMDARLETAGALPKAMAKLPLGVRRALARRQDINLLERLLADADPAVVGNLLNNPRLTEREVVTMAARDPVRQDVLALIARHPRWGVRYLVRLALAYNPSTPTGLTLGLLHFLQEQDLRALASHTRLSRMVTSRAEAIVRERAAGSVAAEDEAEG